MNIIPIPIPILPKIPIPIIPIIGLTLTCIYIYNNLEEISDTFMAILGTVTLLLILLFWGRDKFHRNRVIVSTQFIRVRPIIGIIGIGIGISVFLAKSVSVSV